MLKGVYSDDMKILIMSDSHGQWKQMQKIVENECPQLVFHLGDMISDAQKLSIACPNILIEAVLGNCDGWNTKGDMEHISVYEGVRFFLTHGHGYQVKNTLSLVTHAGQQAKADVTLYGHTHQAHLERLPDGMWLVNPGTVGGIAQPASYVVANVKNSVVELELKWF